MNSCSSISPHPRHNRRTSNSHAQHHTSIATARVLLLQGHPDPCPDPAPTGPCSKGMEANGAVPIKMPPYRNLRWEDDDDHDQEVELVTLDRIEESESPHPHPPPSSDPAVPSAHPDRRSILTLILSCTVAAGVQFGWALQLSLLTLYIQRPLELNMPFLPSYGFVAPLLVLRYIPKLCRWLGVRQKNEAHLIFIFDGNFEFKRVPSVEATNRIRNQMIVSLAAGPWDALFGGGNTPAFLLASVTSLAAGIIAMRKLPNLFSSGYKSSASISAEVAETCFDETENALLGSTGRPGDVR